METTITSVAVFWMLHDLKALVRKERLAHLRPGTMPMLLSGMIEEDFSVRAWPRGTRFRSTFLTGFDLQHMTVYTQNSVYQLAGPGLFVTHVPESYDSDIAANRRALLALDGPSELYH